MRGPRESVAYARRYTRYRSGMCANFVYVVLGADPRGLPSANAAWEASRGRQGPREGVPPAGAPVWFSGGRYGHVALSVGGGRVRSTDWPGAGQVGEVEISRIARAWAHPYRGWADHWADQPIPGIAKAVAPKELPLVYRRKLVFGTQDSDSVKELQRRLRQFEKSLPADGDFGEWTSKVAADNWGWGGKHGPLSPEYFLRRFPADEYRRELWAT